MPYMYNFNQFYCGKLVDISKFDIMNVFLQKNVKCKKKIKNKNVKYHKPCFKIQFFFFIYLNKSTVNQFDQT